MGPIKHKALLNVDLGEGYGNLKSGPDAELLPPIDIANIACGFQCVIPRLLVPSQYPNSSYNTIHQSRNFHSAATSVSSPKKKIK